MLSDRFIRTLSDELSLNKTLRKVLLQEPPEKRTILALLEQHSVDAELLAKALAALLHLSYVDLDTINDKAINLAALPEKLIREQCLLPVAINKKTVCVMLSDPCRPTLIQEITMRLGGNVRFQVVAHDKLVKRITQLLHLQAHEDLTEETSIVQYVEKLLLEAISRRASDIHFETYATRLRIRFRIDGLLYEIAELSLTLAARLVAHLKVLAQMDIAERRLPQDGRLQIHLSSEEKNIDCRLSVCPVIHGEKMVLRILNYTPYLLEIDALGFLPEQKTLFINRLKKPQGMIVVTGPTGSGKTVTLYTALSLLNQPRVNIASVEDPVEIELAGINQVQVNAKIGLTFASVLRAFLRQDPDILMIGEMRDTETADIAIKASQTGHLVLSTLHTNTATESITRLLHLGIPAYQVAASLSLVIAQRLVRCLCEICKVKNDLPVPGCDGITYHPAGCSACEGGYQGRTAIYEILPVTRAIKTLILKQADSQTLTEAAFKEGMHTLYWHGLQKVQQGVTSISEVLRVTDA